MDRCVKKIPFFQQLHQLAQDVDQGTLQYQASMLEDKDFCAPHALKTITDKHKEVKQVGMSLQGSLANLGDDMSQLDEIVSVGTAVLNKQDQVIAGLELHLRQYGYTPLRESDAAKRSKSKQEDVQTASSEIKTALSAVKMAPLDVKISPSNVKMALSELKHSIKTPYFRQGSFHNRGGYDVPKVLGPKCQCLLTLCGVEDYQPIQYLAKDHGNGQNDSSPPRNLQPCVIEEVKRTPRLEDAGISQMSMDYLNSISKPAPNRMNPAAMSSAAKQRLPSVFEHNGIICTPSLTSSNNYSIIDHSALTSPVSPELQSLKFTYEAPSTVQFIKHKDVQEDSSTAFQTVKEKYNPVCSPVTPELLSQQLPHVKMNMEQKMKRNINTKLFQGGAVTDMSCSRPGQSTVVDLNAGCEPQTPELTYSLEPLAEMTGLYQFKPRDVCHETPTSFKNCSQSQVPGDKENATPTEPTLFSQPTHCDMISEAGMSTPKQRQPDKAFLMATPVTPKLIGNYDF